MSEFVKNKMVSSIQLRIVSACADVMDAWVIKISIWPCYFCIVVVLMHTKIVLSVVLAFYWSNSIQYKYKNNTIFNTKMVSIQYCIDNRKVIIH